MSKEKGYTYRSMRDEREYGLYWYSGLWHVLRPILVGLTVLVLVIGIGMTVWGKLYGSFLAPVDEADPQDYSFEINSGESLNRVATNLEKAGLIRNKSIFKYYCDFAGMSQKIQVGSYTIRKDMAMTQIAELLTTGDGNPLVRNITLIPGETVEDFAARLVRNGVWESADKFLAACRDGKAYRDYYYIEDVLASGTAGERKYVLEGYLSPNTYEVYVTATEDDIIRKLLSQTETVFTTENQERAEELGMTMDQVLTLASLIEKEAKESDFARVSAVFHNRLKEGMKLESDVTVHYVTGIRKMALADSDLAVSSPYNTYQVKGLPLGPVCNPSAAAIRAALYPDQDMINDKYLFFCAKEPESGELYFSKTLDQHKRAVEIYAPYWQKYDEDRGIR